MNLCKFVDLKVILIANALILHQCVVVDDAFMRRLQDRDGDAMKLWLEILKTRVETGEPYIMFKDNVNKNNPLAYAMNNLDVSMTNICTEITLHTDEEHSFICCLSSLTLQNMMSGKTLM